MKKKLIMVVGSLLLVTLMVIGGTMAWFTDSKEAVNRFTAGTVDIELVEEFTSPTNWNPGDTTPKDADIIVKSSKRTYVRVLLTPSWGELPLDFIGVKFSNASKWVTENGVNLNTLVGQDGLIPVNVLPNKLYYVDIVKGEPDFTINVIDSVKFLGTSLLVPATDQNLYQGKTFELNIKAEAVQASNKAYKDVWNIDELPAEVETFEPTP